MYLGFGLGLVRDLRFEFDLQFDLSSYFDPRTSLTFLDHQKLVELVEYFVLFNKHLQGMPPDSSDFKGILFVLLTSCRLNKRNEGWEPGGCHSVS